MNKKVFLGLFATSAMMFGTACSSEDLIEQGGGNTATVSFTLSTEDAQSRAYGDGTSARELFYAFYDKDGEPLMDISEFGVICTDLLEGHTIDAKLVKGQKYTVVVFAKDNGAPYSVSYGINTFEVDLKYDSEGYNYNNAEYRDAFYKTYEFTVNGDESINLELTRPFAQINVGTTDYEAAKAAGFDVVKSKVVIKNAANYINLFTGEVSGIQDVTYEYAPFAQDETLTVDGQDYTWLSMCYVLPTETEGSTTVDAEFTFANESESKTVVLADGLDNMPIQRNYRTNILGQLLTNDLNFVVKIDQNFKNSYKLDFWGGDAADHLDVDAEGNYLIKSADDFAYLMESTQNANSAYIGKTIILTTDINFDGRTITGVGSEACNFAGNFDGNGHTISNFVINTTDRSFYAGLFNQMTTANSYVKNLTVENATVVANKMAGVIASSVESGAVVENCHVKNCTVVAKIKKAGAVAGYTAGGTVKGCTAENVEVFCADPAEAESGEIVGYVNAGSTVEDNEATNVNVYRGTTTITTAEEFKALATGNVSVDVNENFALLNDIDLQGASIKGVGSEDFVFWGGFNGFGHTISNFVIDNSDKEYYSALFNQVGETAVIQNLVVDNAKVIGNKIVGVIASGVYGANAKVLNCTVKNSTVIAYVKKAGAVVGYIEEGATVDGCKAENVDVYCAHETEAGEVLGFNNNGNYGSNNTATNVNVVCNAVTVSTAQEFANLGEYNGTINGVVTNKNIVLTADIDLAGVALTPIRLDNSVFNGNGYKLKNVTAGEYGARKSIFNGELPGGINSTVKNLTVEGVTVDGGTFGAVLFGDIQHGGTIAIENVHIYNASVKNAETVGSFVGLVSAAGTHTVTIKNSSVHNSTIEGIDEEGKVGAVVGRSVVAYSCENVVVENVTLKYNGSVLSSERAEGTKSENKCTTGVTFR